MTGPITWWLDRRAKRHAMRALDAQIERLQQQMAYCQAQYRAATGEDMPVDDLTPCRADWLLGPCHGVATTERDGLPLCQECADESDRVDVLRGVSLTAPRVEDDQ